MTTTINHKTYAPVTVCKAHLEAQCGEQACKGQTRTILRECAAGAPQWQPRPSTVKRLTVKVRGERHERFADEGFAWGQILRASMDHDKARATVGEGPREGGDGSPATATLSYGWRQRYAQIRASAGRDAAQAFRKAFKEGVKA